MGREEHCMPRILVVEDDEPTRYAFKKLLTGAGYKAADAPDYREALRIIEDGSPLDVLVVDIVLPSVHGFALARMARMIHHDLKTIYMTAYDLPTNKAVGPVLRKPFKDEQLLAEVAKALP